MCRGDEAELAVQGHSSGQPPLVGFASPTAASSASGTASAVHAGLQAGILASPKGFPAVDQAKQAQRVLLPAPVIMYCVPQEGGMLCWQADGQPPLQLVQVPASLDPLDQPPQHSPVQAPAPLVLPEASASGDEVGETATLDMPLSDALMADGRRREQAVDVLRTSILQKCFEHDGCREVQLAFEVLDSSVLSEMLTRLHGRSVLLSKSPFGNYVMQKVIEVMPPAQVGFILQDLRGSVVGAAKHRYACRILCRLLEHCGSQPGVADIVDELMTQAHELCRHPFAHHVIESVVEHGLPQHRHQVFIALCADLRRNAADRHSSFVVEAALRCCSAADQQALSQALLGVDASGNSLLALAQTRFGSYVVRSLLKLPGASATTAARLRQDVKMLWETRHGRRLLKDVGIDQGEVLAAGAAAA